MAAAPLSMADIPVFGNVLLKLGEVDTLTLILHSPGGDGQVVEKFVSLCRTQCKRFRIVIPNEAKSAATLIALGADEIVMGSASELGPIDAQIPVVIDGVRRYLSAQSYIDARDSLVEQYKKSAAGKEDTGAITQALATLNYPFIAECERMMDFGRDVAKSLLEKYMFKRDKDRDQKIGNIVETLSSVKRFKVHGRYIDGNTAKRELKLKVKLLGHDDDMWKKVWEYYTRADMLFQRGVTKIFETEHEMIIGVP